MIISKHQTKGKEIGSILFIVIMVLLSTIAYADSSESLFEQANKLYSEGKYVEATQAYESIVNNGYESANLFFNLGNSYYKQGLLPNAIINFERAIKLSPKDKDILFNLELSYAQTIDQLEQVPEFFLKTWYLSFMESLSGNTWAIISLVGFILFLVAVLVYFLAVNLSVKKVGFYLGILLLAGSIASISFSLSTYQEKVKSKSAIVFSPAAMVKGSPDKSGIDLFLLHEGTKIMVRDSLELWYQIKLTDGNEGWVEKRQVEII